MPEKLGFACFLERPEISSLCPIVDAAMAVFGDHLGPAIDFMVLDWSSGRCETQPWSREDPLLRTWPSPPTILFVYFGVRGSCMSFAGTTTAAVVNISMKDMALASQPEEVDDLCLRLHAIFSDFAAECVVAAAGEIGLREGLTTAREALLDVTAPFSTGRWIVCRGDRSDLMTTRFVEERRSPAATLYRRAE